MSTCTHIQTQIRDRGVMHRVLSSIPGARVESNAVVPAKAGGYVQTAFRVVVPNEAINAESFFSSLFQGGVREFWVYEEYDGTMLIEVSHDVGAQYKLAGAIDQALKQERHRQQGQSAEQERLLEQQRQKEIQRQKEQARKREVEIQRQKEAAEKRKREAEERKLAEQRRRQADAEHRRQIEDARQAEQAAREKDADERRQREREEAEREAKMIAEQLAMRHVSQTPDPPLPTQDEPPDSQPPTPSSDSQQDALEILKRLTQPTGAPVSSKQFEDGNSDDPSPSGDPGLSADLNNAISQEYSRQIVMETIENVEEIYGINLRDVNQLKDGSIQIRLNR